MIAVVFATYNGASTLNQTLEAFCGLEEPEAGYRLIVVDNASTDETSDILQAFSRRLPMTVLNEPRPGKNYSLNSAIDYLASDESECDLYIFTDDDVLPEKDWLNVYERARIERADYSLFGGQVHPHWRKEQPAWLEAFSDEFVMLYAESRDKEGACDPSRIFGPNMAIRKSVFEKGLRYNENFGLKGQRADSTEEVKSSWLLTLVGGSAAEPMGSETGFLMKAEALGEKAWYLEKAVVGHIVREFQQEWEWVLKRSYRAGKGRFLLNAPEEDRLFLGVPYWLFKDAVLNTAKLWKAKARKSEEERRLSYKLEWIKGAISGAHSQYLSDGRRSA